MLKWAFLVCAALFLGALYKDGVPPEPGALRFEIAREPLQEPISSPHIKTRVGGVDYTIEPSHLYDIYGLVVSKHNADTWWDWVHAASNDHLNVTDLCVVWGSNATSGAYRDMAFSSGQWTCNFQTNSDAAFKAFDITKISNNHLLTDKPSLAKKLRQVRVGDQIHITGQLAAYRHQSGMDFFRGTSTTRLDTGDGACETIFVSDVSVIASAPAAWRRLAWAGGLGTLLCALAGLFMPYRVRS